MHQVSRADRSLTVIVAAEEKLEWDSAECKTPTTPRSRIPEPMTCPPAPMKSWPRHDFDATEEELECRTPSEPCYRIPEPTTCPPAPMKSCPRHDFNANKVFIFTAGSSKMLSPLVRRLDLKDIC